MKAVSQYKFCGVVHLICQISVQMLKTTVSQRHSDTFTKANDASLCHFNNFSSLSVAVRPLVLTRSGTFNWNIVEITIWPSLKSKLSQGCSGQKCPGLQILIPRCKETCLFGRNYNKCHIIMILAVLSIRNEPLWSKNDHSH